MHIRSHVVCVCVMNCELIFVTVIPLVALYQNTHTRTHSSSSSSSLWKHDSDRRALRDEGRKVRRTEAMRDNGGWRDAEGRIGEEQIRNLGVTKRVAG